MIKNPLAKYMGRQYRMKWRIWDVVMTNYNTKTGEGKITLAYDKQRMTVTLDQLSRWKEVI